VIVAVLIPALAVLSLLGRLSGLQRAATRLQRRQEQATRLQHGAAVLQRSIAALQDRAEQSQRQVAVIKAGRGDRPTLPQR
jgi:type II secretory pathway component PulJ